ncbi:BRO-N domain-containing protein [Symbiopectobacterium purcellii]|uniref:BRO-N domain-containing protein n=1 Tax=Symbiopectobacterium purcellii TaxID=2871826 RepID=UPI003F845814
MPSHFDLTFQDSYKIRIIIIDDQPWFVASDVCGALSIVNTARALSRLDEDEKDIHNMNTPGGEQKLSTINESGLYSLILTSRKAEARKFKKWVTSEVLPTIRKTGKYEHPTHKPEAREPLTADDTSHLARLIWGMSNGFRFERSWSNAIWHALRYAVGVSSPQHFGVSHIPILAEECQRIYSFTNALKEVMYDAEKQAVRRVLKNREDAEAVVSEMKQLLDETNQSHNLLLTNTLARWQQADIQRFLQRH